VQLDTAPVRSTEFGTWAGTLYASSIVVDIGRVRMAQQDGGPPTTVAAGSAPGESGVSILSVRFDGGMHLLATPRCHCVCFQMSPGRVERRGASNGVWPVASFASSVQSGR
jgi:hypothetical protein